MKPGFRWPCLPRPTAAIRAWLPPAPSSPPLPRAAPRVPACPLNAQPAPSGGGQCLPSGRPAAGQLEEMPWVALGFLSFLSSTCWVFP